MAAPCPRVIVSYPKWTLFSLGHARIPTSHYVPVKVVWKWMTGWTWQSDKLMKFVEVSISGKVNEVEYLKKDDLPNLRHAWKSGIILFDDIIREIIVKGKSMLFFASWKWLSRLCSVHRVVSTQHSMCACILMHIYYFCCPGHFLYEMLLGQELNAAKAENHHVAAVQSSLGAQVSGSRSTFGCTSCTYFLKYFICFCCWRIR